MRVCFVSVPFDLGRYNFGNGLGPRKLMSSGLDRMISEAGHTADSKTEVPNTRLTIHAGNVNRDSIEFVHLRLSPFSTYPQIATRAPEKVAQKRWPL